VNREAEKEYIVGSSGKKFIVARQFKTVWLLAFSDGDLAGATIKDARSCLLACAARFPALPLFFIPGVVTVVCTAEALNQIYGVFEEFEEEGY